MKSWLIKTGIGDSLNKLQKAATLEAIPRQILHKKHNQPPIFLFQEWKQLWNSFLNHYWMFLWRRVKPDWVLASPASTFRASTATNTSHGQIQIKTKTNADKNKNKTKWKIQMQKLSEPLRQPTPVMVKACKYRLKQKKGVYKCIFYILNSMKGFFEGPT